MQASANQLVTTLHLHNVTAIGQLKYIPLPHSVNINLRSREEERSSTCAERFPPRLKSGTRDPDTVLDAEECVDQKTPNASAPLGKRSVSEVGGGAASTAKNTGIALDRDFLSLTGIIIL